MTTVSIQALPIIWKNVSLIMKQVLGQNTPVVGAHSKLFTKKNLKIAAVHRSVNLRLKNYQN